MQNSATEISDFNRTVREEWGGAETALAWQKHHLVQKVFLAGVTLEIASAAEVAPGMEVLDLASGTGEPALTLARLVGPDGLVTATDISDGMLSALRSNADSEAATNIRTILCDAQRLPFPDASFDRVTSRFGIMFFGDTAGALQEIYRVLKPGGRVALLVWGGPSLNSFFGRVAMPFMKRLASRPDPDGPGPMRFAEPGKLRKLVEAAGFTSVTEVDAEVAAPYPGTPAEMLTNLMDLAGPFRNAASTLSLADHQEAEREVIEGLQTKFDGITTNVTAPVIVVAGYR